MLIERHPLGFTKVNVLRLFGFRIRLHFWSGDSIEDCHNHRWAFIGIPIFGRFRDTRFMRTTGTRYRRVDCYPANASNERRYEPKQRDGLREVARHVRYPLVPYVCHRNQIHSYVPIGRGPHVSLVFLGRAKTTKSDVWQPANEE